MLKKLMKYEWKAQRNSYLATYLIVGAFAVIATVTKQLNRSYGSGILEVVSGITFAAFIAGLGALAAVTTVINIIRFRNNLLKDEGYLMNTLPVRPIQLIGSKLAANMIWLVTHLVFGYLLLSAYCADIFWLKHLFLDSIKVDFPSVNLPLVVTLAVLYLLTTYVMFDIQIYFCLTTGYRATSNKDATALITYIATYVVLQVLSLAELFLYYCARYHSLQKMLTESTMVLGDVYAIVGINYLSLLIISAILLVVANGNMTRHLNLE